MLSGNVMRTGKDQDVRRALRMDVNVEATIREHGSSKFVVNLRDLSVTGFRFETVYTVKLHSHIWLTIPGLQALEAAVAWHRDPLFGAAFINPLHPAVCDHIVKQFKLWPTGFDA